MKDNIKRIVACGPRAKDYVFRLQLAGFPADRIRCTMDEFEAPELLEFTPGESVYLFYGTDSLNLAAEVKEKLRRAAAAKAEWRKSHED